MKPDCLVTFPSSLTHAFLMIADQPRAILRNAERTVSRQSRGNGVAFLKDDNISNIQLTHKASPLRLYRRHIAPLCRAPHEVERSVCTKRTTRRPLDSRVHLRAKGFPCKEEGSIKDDGDRRAIAFSFFTLALYRLIAVSFSGQRLSPSISFRNLQHKRWTFSQRRFLSLSRTIV